MTDAAAPRTRVAEGELAGAWEDGIAAFRNVPAAAAGGAVVGRAAGGRERADLGTAAVAARPRAGAAPARRVGGLPQPHDLEAGGRRREAAGAGVAARRRHCIELPFVFDNHAARDAPMLAGGDAREMVALGRVVNAAWAAFVRTGNPEHAGLPYWPPSRTPERATLRIDRQVEVAGDLAGVGRGRPWPDNIPL